MGNFQGDLTDVIRGRDTAAEEEEDAWPLPIASPPPDHDFLVGDDSFTRYLREPLLHDVIPPPTVFSGMFLDISPPPPPPLICDLGAEEGSKGVQIPSPRNTGIKRRRSQSKKVVCIPAPAPAPPNSRSSGEVVPSDLWAWRKYGQKPIKGSPYPRGYYRCSSSKGCLARKQVERSKTDPNMLVITYTSEHNHPWPTQRNALAGSTRSKSVNKTPRGDACTSATVKEETYFDGPRPREFYDYKTEWNNSDESLGETEADSLEVPFPRGFSSGYDRSFYDTAGVGNSSGEKTVVNRHTQPYIE